MSLATHSFQLAWRLEDFSLWAGEIDSKHQWPQTPTLSIEAKRDTEWKFKLGYIRDEEFVACSFERCRNTDMKEGTDIHYTISSIEQDGSSYSQATGILYNLKPGDQRLVNILKVVDINLANCPDKLFRIACTFRQQVPSEPVDVFRGKWQDELETLTDDMRRLFETGYLSDLKLVSDDGHRIAVHSFILIARWRMLCESLSENGFTPHIAVHGVSGSVLQAFVSYLYTGTLSGSDVTAELFDFAVKNIPWMSKHFYSCASDVRMRTRQRKECLAFTWYVNDLGDDSLPFTRVLPLHDLVGEELVLEIDTSEDNIGERHVNVTFSIADVPEEYIIAFNVTIKLFIKNSCAISLAFSNNFVTDRSWKLLRFFPVHLLGSTTPTCPRVEFEIVISDTPKQSVVQDWVTKFRTGSRGIQKEELLSSDMRRFFMWDLHNLDDVHFKTKDGSFFSSRAVLGIRSKTWLSFFKTRRIGSITIPVTEMDSLALSCVLEYVYTGWTKLSTLEEVSKVIEIAKRFSLLGLVEKCQLFIDLHTSRPLDS